LVGRDSLSEDQKLVLEIAKIVREDFLQQDAFSKHDYMCPLYKTVGMMRCIVTFFDAAKKSIVDSSQTQNRITWNYIASQMGPHLVALTKLNRTDPKLPQKEVQATFGKLCDEIVNSFRGLAEK